MIDLASIPAPVAAVQPKGWMLWSRPRRAYLAASGRGFTRRMERAAVMDHVQMVHHVTMAVMNGGAVDDLQPEMAFARENTPPRPPRADLADVDDTELLRRAVRGLCARDRTQAPQWCVVMDSLGLTSAAAVMLCRRLNIEPMKRTGL